MVFPNSPAVSVGSALAVGAWIYGFSEVPAFHFSALASAKMSYDFPHVCLTPYYVECEIPGLSLRYSGILCNNATLVGTKW